MFNGQNNSLWLDDAPVNISTNECTIADTEPKRASLLLFGLVIAGAVGNLMVCIAVAYERKLHNVTNYFLFSLAMADCMVSVTVMPLTIINQLNDGVWLYGYVTCTIYSTLDVFFCSVSIVHMAVIALDRYRGITQPFQSRNRSMSAVALKVASIWSLTAVMTLPIVVIAVYDPDSIWNECSCGVRPTLSIAAFQIYGTILTFFIPAIIMIVTYVKTVLTLKKQLRLCSGWNGRKVTLVKCTDKFGCCLEGGGRRLTQQSSGRSTANSGKSLFRQNTMEGLRRNIRRRDKSKSLPAERMLKTSCSSISSRRQCSRGLLTPGSSRKSSRRSTKTTLDGGRVGSISAQQNIPQAGTKRNLGFRLSTNLSPTQSPGMASTLSPNSYNDRIRQLNQEFDPNHNLNSPNIRNYIENRDVILPAVTVYVEKAADGETFSNSTSIQAQSPFGNYIDETGFELVSNCDTSSKRYSSIDLNDRRKQSVTLPRKHSFAYPSRNLVCKLIRKSSTSIAMEPQNLVAENQSLGHQTSCLTSTINKSDSPSGHIGLNLGNSKQTSTFLEVPGKVRSVSLSNHVLPAIAVTPPVVGRYNRVEFSSDTGIKLIGVSNNGAVRNDRIRSGESIELDDYRLKYTINLHDLHSPRRREVQVNASTIAESRRLTDMVARQHEATGIAALHSINLALSAVLNARFAKNRTRKHSAQRSRLQRLWHTACEYFESHSLKDNLRRAATLHFLSRRESVAIVARETKATKVLGVIFSCFFICWTPFFVTNIFLAVCGMSCHNAFPSWLATTFLWLGYSSSIINPIIYTTFNQLYRQTFKKLILCQAERHRTNRLSVLNNTFSRQETPRQ